MAHKRALKKLLILLGGSAEVYFGHHCIVNLFTVKMLLLIVLDVAGSFLQLRIPTAYKFHSRNT